MHPVIRGFVATAALAAALAFVLGPAALHASAQERAARPAFHAGGELDALPYATGGYYSSGFLSRGDWRFRSVITRTNIPSLLVSNGYRDKRSDAYALLCDRFIGPRRNRLEGLWIGGGAEYWRNRIRSDASPLYTHYQNYMATAGAGYVLPLSRHFYLNPWAGGHVVLANNRSIAVSGSIYHQPVFTPEASVKIGVRF